MKHTPGPWKYEANYFNRPKDNNKEKSGTIISLDGWNVAEIWKDFGDHSESTANAHLIAAAPELLEALYDCAASLAMYKKAAGEDIAKSTTLLKASAAIQRAEGREGK
jgi:hypothetical protein